MRLNKAIGIIGCGNMGSAILAGLLGKRIVQRSQIFVYDSTHSKMKLLSQTCRVNAVRSNLALVRRAGIVILAVKPQDIGSVAVEVRDHLRTNQIVISILAGMLMSKMKQLFGTRPAIVRAMPNLGAQVGEAVTALTGPNRFALRLAEMIFLGCGKVIRLPEKYFDLVTAVSGSGPAYFFLMMELLTQVGHKGGLSEKAARFLAVQTAVGASKLAQSSSHSPEELRKMVTSKKGTTEAALSFLFRNHFPKLFHDALSRAVRRSHELSES